MKQIERYIFGRIATLTLWSLFSVTVLALTTQILIRINVLSTSSSAIASFAKLALALVPSVLVVVAPFAMMIGVGRILMSMNSDSELVVIEATGASYATAARPTLIFTLLLSASLFITTFFIEPVANRGLYNVLANARADLLSLAAQSGSFQKVEDGLYLQIGESLAGGDLGEIFLSDQRDGAIQLLYFAKTGTIRKTGNGNILVMSDGEIQRMTKSDGQLSVVNFSSYALDLSAFIPTPSDRVLSPIERDFDQLYDLDASDPFFEDTQKELPKEIHRRLSSWLYPIAFGLIILTYVGRAQSHRGNQMQNMATAVVLCLVLRVLGFYTLSQSGQSVIMAGITYILPIIAIVFFAILMLLGKGLKTPEALVNIAEKITQMSNKSNGKKSGGQI